MKPLAIDLFCGSFGWSAGWLECGGRVVGFDLVLQDVRTIHGSQFADASLILASSPCQEFSYLAMPWKRSRVLAPKEVGVSVPAWWELPQSKLASSDLAEWKRWQIEHPRPYPLLGMELFAQAARIQAEAIAAAGRFIPMVQENVRGAQKWVGRARWHYGSYYLWGDVPALMPITLCRVAMKQGVVHRSNGETNFHGHERADDSTKIGGARGDDWFVHHNRPEFEDRATKNEGGSWFNVGSPGQKVVNQNPIHDGVKQGGDWFNAESLGVRDRSRRRARLHRRGSQSYRWRWRGTLRRSITPTKSLDAGAEWGVGFAPSKIICLT